MRLLPGADWLKRRHGGKVSFTRGDVRDEDSLAAAAHGAGAVFHMAAQVAVTTSMVDPRDDFAINAQGTLTLLEAVRRRAPDVPLVFASTNKVYGALADLAVEPVAGAYLPKDPEIRRHGVGERAVDASLPATDGEEPQCGHGEGHHCDAREGKEQRDGSEQGECEGDQGGYECDEAHGRHDDADDAPTARPQRGGD